MSVEKKVQFNGFTTFWGLTDRTNADTLRENLDAIGLGDLLPDVRDDGPALKRAIRRYYPGKHTLVRELPGIVGFAVVQEETAGAEMEYEEEFRVGLADGMLFTNPMDHPSREGIRAAYQEEKNIIPAAKIGGLLVRVANRLSGIRLRPTGGFYWLPNTSRDTWEQVCGAVEASNRENVIWHMRTTTDERTVDAVCDSLTIQVESRLEKLEEELAEGALGERALRTRENEAQELDALVKTYEGILGKTLKGLRARADAVEQSACLAILEASVAVA